MVKYICFCQMTPEFLRLPLEKRKERIPIWKERARAQTEVKLRMVKIVIPVSDEKGELLSDHFARARRVHGGISKPSQ